MGIEVKTNEAQRAETKEPVKEILLSMIAALEMEIYATDQILGRQQGIALSFGTRESDDARPIYRFHPASDMPSGADDSWLLIGRGGKRIEGRLVGWDAETVVWQAQKDHGTQISEARLVPDQTQLLRSLKERLAEMLETADQEGGGGINWELIEQTINLKPPGVRAKSTKGIDMKGLNERQQRAVKSAFTNTLTLLWGPPGTGKTTTLASMLTALAESGQSVLLISNTNVAVDAALTKVVDRWRGHPALEGGEVQRLGRNYTDELKTDDVEPYVIPEKIVMRRSAGIQDTLRQIRHQRDEAERDARIWESIEALNRDIDVQRRLASEKSDRLAQLQQEADRLQVQWTKHQKSLKRATQRKPLTGIGHNRLQQRREVYERVYTQWRTITADITRLTSERDEHQAEHTSAKHKMQLIKAEYDIDPVMVSEALRYSKSARAAVQRLAAQEAAQEAKIEELARNIHKARRVTATTLTQAFREQPANMAADVVIVDEASMALLPTVIYAAGLARRAVVYIGDFRQLPAVVLSDQEIARRWLRQDVFTLHGVGEALSNHRDLPYLVALNEQHRMDKAICDVVNTLFYADSPLITMVDTTERPSNAFPSGALLYVDTSQWGSYTERGPRGTSKVNPLHATAITAIVKKLSESGDSGVGVTTPYRPQVTLLQETVAKAGIGADIMIDTIHRYQGSERPIMILDVSDAPGTPTSQFMQARSLDEDGARLLNVAITRAKKQVIVVVNTANFKPNRAVTERSLSRKLVDYLQRNGQELRLDQVVATATGNALWDQIAHDVQSAPHEVHVAMPEITDRLVTNLLQWRQSDTGGRNVTLLTRPPQQQIGETQRVAQWFDQLRTQGIVVRTELNLVRSAVSLGSEVVWFLAQVSDKDTDMMGFRAI